MITSENPFPTVDHEDNTGRFKQEVFVQEVTESSEQWIYCNY